MSLAPGPSQPGDREPVPAGDPLGVGARRDALLPRGAQLLALPGERLARGASVVGEHAGAALEVPLRRHAVGLAEVPGPLRAEQRADLVGRPDVEAPFRALAVGVLAGEEAAAGVLRMGWEK